MKRLHAYLMGALDLIERTALFSDTVDWPTVRQNAETMLRDATSYADTHELLATVLKQAGGKHSRVLARQRRGRTRSEATHQTHHVGPRLPTGKMIDSVGHLWLPRLSDGRRLARDYVTAGGKALAELVTAHPRGWIVDLRANGGGNMWPMLAVAAPLLPDGVLGHFGLPDGSHLAWSLDRGSVRLAGKRMARSHSPAHRADAPIAVLVSRHTASAGEAVAVAFSGLPNVRLIGTPTAGFTTGNSTHVLRDGTRLYISGSHYADRDRHRVDGQIPVDIAADNTDRNAPVDAALSWLDQV